MISRVCVTVLACVLLFPSITRGHEASPDELSFESLLEVPVSSASKRPQRPEDAPSMVSIVSATDIQRFGWRTLGEALNSLRGIHLTYDRGYTALGVRGFGRPSDYNNRILLLIDGVPINDGVYDQAPIGTEFPVDMALVDRIEYVPGAGSVLYGGNAFFGVVNVITATGGSRQWRGTHAEAGVGSSRSAGLRMTHGERTESGSDWLFSASRSRQRGADLFYESYARPGANAWSRGLDHAANDRLFARMSRGGLVASLVVSDRNKGVPGGPWGSDLNDPRNREHETRLLASIAYEQRLDTERTVHLQAYASRYSYDGHWAYSGALSSDRLENQALGGEARLVSKAFSAHTMVAGVSWRHDGLRRQFNSSLDVDTPRRTLGIFIQDDWILNDFLTLSAGLRHDRVVSHVSQQHLSPRLALIVRPQSETTLKLIQGTAFRSPNGYETDYAFTGTNIANRSLQPESIRSTELGLEHALTPTTHLALSVYRNQIKNLIVQETDTATSIQQHKNAGDADARGVELGIRFQTPGRWGEIEWRGSVSRQRVVHQNGIPVANTPQYLAKWLMAAPLPNSMNLGWEAHYLGSRTTDSGSVARAGNHVGGHVVSHATLSGVLTSDAHWQLRITNLFDRRYGAVAGTEFSKNFPAVQSSPMPLVSQDGRGFHGSVTWHF